MSSRKKFFLVFCFIILDMFLLIGYLVIRDATMRNDLRKEIHELSKLDITRDRYNRKLKTKGDYATVEKAIKEYLDDYAVSLQEVLKVIDDKELTTILSSDNYTKDGPEFTNSLKYLNTTKDQFNEDINILILNLEEDNIKNYINDKTNDPYYRNLYIELMLDEDMKGNFSETKRLLENTKKDVNNIFSVSTEVLNFLSFNKGNWQVEEGQIKFQTQDLYNQYNTLISKLHQ